MFFFKKDFRLTLSSVIDFFFFDILIFLFPTFNLLMKKFSILKIIFFLIFFILNIILINNHGKFSKNKLGVKKICSVDILEKISVEFIQNTKEESMRGSRSKAQQYIGNRTLLYKKLIYYHLLNSLVNFAVFLDPRIE